MIIIPAVDIRQGNSVRLKQGKIDAETIYSKDPVSIAKLWKSKGAKRLHVVDLDGAFSGTNINKDIIKNICAVVDIPVEVGGGIRNMDKIKESFDIGATYVILGTIAFNNPEIVKKAVDKYGSEKIIVAVDAKDGKVAISGWKDITSIDVSELVNKLKEIGVQEILYTDISRDGMLAGPDFAGLKKLSESGMRIIASGGVKTIDDLVKLKKYEKDGVFAAIVGSALYTDDFKLEDAIEKIE
ncbi:1-(5-phosphoribosyl)-5-((5-phosphoribosylamino)methylideneamino)imidazole-4-carboxamide isomerase [Candidatus Endomicrobiellum trichonymphae]|uniref:1-(5-phosphoribosyl)-5-[(5-phosphoribosylamino)methylideneamino] imidazole-4-carboxamide isomerase n=1 Tax=Endomicrobium trichonymphae TaxID=1408204 RepID=A0A1E5IMS0_ENDTX|nr:1-(5-phosphoribosyl)-5-((5-phosphoribosylamino)methylideneamino)imidazole-4-carboxamide isomerase [Candidatus Endomicrobium trichonymphae]